MARMKVKTRAAPGRFTTAFLLLIGLIVLGAGRSGVSTQLSTAEITSASEGASGFAASEVDAVLSAPDAQREQAVRHAGEVAEVGLAAGAPQWKRLGVTQATKPSCTPGEAARSRIRALIVRRAGVALMLAFEVSGASRHTTSVPPPNNA